MTTYQMYNTSKNYYSTAVYQMYSNIYQTYIKHISNIYQTYIKHTITIASKG